MVAMRKVIAGITLSIVVEKVGEVFSKPNKYNPWFNVILPKKKDPQKRKQKIYEKVSKN